MLIAAVFVRTVTATRADSRHGVTVVELGCEVR